MSASDLCWMPAIPFQSINIYLVDTLTRIYQHTDTKHMQQVESMEVFCYAVVSTVFVSYLLTSVEFTCWILPRMLFFFAFTARFECVWTKGNRLKKTYLQMFEWSNVSCGRNKTNYFLSHTCSHLFDLFIHIGIHQHIKSVFSSLKFLSNPTFVKTQMHRIYFHSIQLQHHFVTFFLRK